MNALALGAVLLDKSYNGNGSHLIQAGRKVGERLEVGVRVWGEGW